MPDTDPPSQSRPGTHPTASHYALELPYAEELQALLEGRYIVENFLGQGGMGAVYKGLQLPLKRPVAIKILAKQQSGVEDEFDFEERFKREAYAMAALTHPNIVQVYDCGDAGENFLFISMELVEGGDLSQMIRAGGVTPEVALGMIGPICDGLAAAHDRGLVHRDIKPANIFLTVDGRPKVADFGLAKKFDVKSTFVTKTGLGMGTPDYAAPEQYEGVSDIDHRADIYALGVMFYQMLTGSLPRGAYKAPSQRVAIDPRLDDVVQKAMEQDRAERYQNVLDLKNDVQLILATWMQGPPPEPTPEVAVPANPRGATSSISRVQRPTPTAPRSGALPQPAPEKKGPGLLLAVLAVAVIGGGAFFLLRKPEAGEETSNAGAASSGETASVTAPAASSPMPATSPSGSDGATSPKKESSPPTGLAPTPIPPTGGNTLGFGPAVIRSGPADGFSNFAPTAQWRSGFADDQSWGNAWRRRENEMVMADNSPGRNAMFLFAENPEASGVRVRFRSSATRSFLDLIQRLQKVGYGPRYVVTLWSGGDAKPTIDFLPRKNDGNRRSLVTSEKAVKVGNQEVHTAEFYAVGEQLTLFVDGVQVAAVKDAKFQKGYPGIFIGSGTEILSIEAADLSNVTLANGPSQTSPAPSTPPGDVSKEWVNLLARADVARDSLMEKWTLEDGVLRSPAEPRGPNSQGGHTTFVFPIDAPLKSYDLRLRMSRDTQGYGMILGFFRDGKEGMFRVDSERGLGFALDGTSMNTEKKCFPVGEVHEVKLEVREASVRAFYDGQLLVDHPGELPPVRDTYFFNHKPRKPNWLTVGLCMGRMSIQEASFRGVDENAPKPSNETGADPRLAQLEKGFRSRLETDVEVSHRADVAKLNQSYLANGLPRARQAAQGKGNLAEVEALDAEKGIIERGEPMPLEDVADLPASLKALRATYRSALAKLEADRAKKAVPLYDLYVGALDTYIVELTKANRVDEAKTVQGLRENLVNEKALLQGKAAAPATAAETVTSKTAPAPGSAAAKEDGRRPSLRAAEFLAKNAGSCIAVVNNGQRVEIKAEADIPSRRFDLHELNFDRLNSSMPPPTAKDFDALAGLKELRRVWIRIPNSKLPDSAFSWLTGNEELDFLNLESAGDLSSKILDYLMSSKKLTYLSIQYAPSFDGEGLDKLPCVSTVDRADFLSTGFSDQGLLSISAYTKLRDLRITTKGTMTDKGLAVLGKLTNLERLSISECDFGEAAAEGISKLEKLQDLYLANTAIDDKALKKLKSLKNLQMLNLRGCKVTAKGVEDFKTEVSSCQVSY